MNIKFLIFLLAPLLAFCSSVFVSTDTRITLEDLVQNGEEIRILIVKTTTRFRSPNPLGLSRWSHNTNSELVKAEFFYYTGNIGDLFLEKELNFYKVGEHRKTDEGIKLNLINAYELVADSKYTSCETYSGQCFYKPFETENDEININRKVTFLSFDEELFDYSPSLSSDSLRIYRKNGKRSDVYRVVPINLNMNKKYEMSLRIF